MKVSFIIPAHNEAEFIQPCLQRLQMICHNSSLNTELIVIDNDSDDNTAALARHYRCTVRHYARHCPAAIRNFGSTLASGDILVFVDADTLLPMNWLDHALTLLSHPRAGACGGPHLAALDANSIQRAWNPDQVHAFYEENAKLHGCNIAIKKTVFAAINGFDEHLISAEDDDLSKRIQQANFQCIKDSRLAVIHLGYPKTLWQIFKQQRWHGSSQLRAHGFFRDKMLGITFLWLIALTAMISALSTALMSGMNEYCQATLSLSLMLLAAIAFIIMINRNKYRQHISVHQSLIAYGIAHVFIAGRALGLLEELYHKLPSCSAIRRRYSCK